MSHHSTVSTSHSAGRHATHSCLQIRNAKDVHLIFEAVRLNILPMIRRRLGPSERDLLCSGEVFVWEESDQKGGLERWTDGRRWSQSRMREPFLYYEEKEPTTREEKEAKAARRAYKNVDASIPLLYPSRRQDRPSKPGGLTKQTYSSYAKVGRVSRKWHLVAYFNAADYNRLPVVDDYDYLKGISVPSGIYLSAKELNIQSDDDARDEKFCPSYQDRSLSSASSSAPYPCPSVSSRHPPTPPYTTTPNGHSRYHHDAYMRSISLAENDSEHTSPYPRVYPSRNTHFPTSGSTPQTSKLPSARSDSKRYNPLTSEDQRALGAFRIAL